ncbi:glycosyl hydrolase 108 family protein, partial [Acinetobacter baumannii]
MDKTFQTALKRVLQHEGGYINHPSDPGGETNYGITKSVARQYGYKGSMKDIPMDIVEKIYKNQYWNAMSCDNFPFSVAFQLFDA